MPLEVAARLLGGLAVLPGEDGDRVIGLGPCCSASRTPGRILPAAQPQIEFTTSMVVPGTASAASTSAAVRASATPALVNSSRIGITINSGYIVLPPENLFSPSLYFLRAPATRPTPRQFLLAAKDTCRDRQIPS
jgi:hypothetical protein